MFLYPSLADPQSQSALFLGTFWVFSSFILKVGSKKSPNYYRVYENNQEIRFELEMKSNRVQSVQDFLFNHQILEFEQILTKHF